MIILPDRNIARGKFLMPMRKRDWHGPHPFGPDVSLIFNTWIAQAWRADHSMVWQGHFEDREDADEFMAALVSGVIKHDRYLQRLPIYCPDFDPHMLEDPGIFYNMVSNIGISLPSVNWGSPSDCYGLNNRAGEFIDVIGAGGGGAGAVPFWAACGGGGGGFARITAWGGGPSTVYPVGVSGGAAGGTGAATGANGAGAGITWFHDPSVVQATGGGGGLAGVAAGGGGGGTVAVGSAGAAGGRGGNGSDANNPTTGGGGAAGPVGGGSNGGDTTTGITAGGNANGNTIGPDTNGNYYGPWGPGGGGTGKRSAANGVVGNGGGGFGGGGGGCQTTGSTAFTGIGGSGSNGLIVVRYEPQTVPVVSSISPTSGPTGGGQAVTISGSSFVEVTTVNIGGATLTGIGVPSTTTITGTTSAGGAGLYNVNVFRNHGPSPGVGGSLYRYVAPPAVSSISPNVGPTGGGTAVTITGSGFTGAGLSNVSAANIGGAALTSLVVVNDTTITGVTSAGAAGLYNVSVTNGYGTGTGTNLFTYGLLATVSSCSPDIGLIFGNTLVTVTGANFTGTTVVRFGGANATSIAVVNSTTITCRTPAHAKGLVNVDVTNTFGLGTSSPVFTYLLPASGFNMPMMGI